jgi:hypothetical protein
MIKYKYTTFAVLAILYIFCAIGLFCTIGFKASIAIIAISVLSMTGALIACGFMR